MVEQMKIKPEDYTELKGAIGKLDIEKVKKHYAHLRTDTRVKDLAKRFRWDLLYASKFDTLVTYKYLDDTHLDTALHSIVKELNLELL
jgi:hypothetical protein